MSNSGIIKDFEVDKGAGRYLSDGLHPNVAGQQVQAKYIVSEIVARMTY
jgi:lysophospholipase L1-like esterase